MLIFQSTAELNGLTKVLVLPKGEKLQYFESFNSFPKEILKKWQIQNFSWPIVNRSVLRTGNFIVIIILIIIITVIIIIIIIVVVIIIAINLFQVHDKRK